MTTVERRVVAVAIFATVAFVVLAFLLQQQQAKTRELVHDRATNQQIMCEHRRANTIHLNDTWDALAEIERRNKFINEDIRRSRLAVYERAKLSVPECA